MATRCTTSMLRSRGTTGTPRTCSTMEAGLRHRQPSRGFAGFNQVRWTADRPLIAKADLLFVWLCIDGPDETQRDENDGFGVIGTPPKSLAGFDGCCHQLESTPSGVGTGHLTNPSSSRQFGRNVSVGCGIYGCSRATGSDHRAPNDARAAKIERIKGRVVSKVRQAIPQPGVAVIEHVIQAQVTEGKMSKQSDGSGQPLMGWRGCGSVARHRCLAFSAQPRASLRASYLA